jgi:hypothetical protein
MREREREIDRERARERKEATDSTLLLGGACRIE